MAQFSVDDRYLWISSRETVTLPWYGLKTSSPENYEYVRNLILPSWSLLQIPLTPTNVLHSKIKIMQVVNLLTLPLFSIFLGSDHSLFLLLFQQTLSEYNKVSDTYIMVNKTRIHPLTNSHINRWDKRACNPIRYGNNTPWERNRYYNIQGKSTY